MLHALSAIAAVLWLLSIFAVVLAFRWSFLSVPGRFWPAVILSTASIVTGYLGLTRFHIAAAKTVNGQLQWRFDSRWLFIVTLLFGAFTLAYTLWKRTRAAHVAVDPVVPR
jgi:hypothetical protein